MTNNEYAEMGIFISSFQNRGVYFTVGSSLFIADLLSRNWNNMLVKTGSNISKEFSQIIPYLPKNPKERYITPEPEQLIDFLAHEVTPERLDCFPMYREYQQLNNQYHTLTDFLRFEKNVQPLTYWLVYILGMMESNYLKKNLLR